MFCAVPMCMAMASLSLCFMNPEMFQRNIKIRKAEAAKLIMQAMDTRKVALIFRDYACKIHNKAKLQDPNFLQLSLMCCKIEQWYEQNYSSSVVEGENGVTYNSSDKGTAIVRIEEKRAMQNSLVMCPWELVNYVVSAFALVLGLSAGVVYTFLKVYGDV
ncbi:hypothetical protein BDN67DRAFT_1037742 [Paxillus ammoniavirescens]|nr:hypothetical protein BDN67DRAFT_1037742 [Paxillus ammoniavirescens]